MPLAPGTRLGPYEILAPLGAGGMGEVYRARDSRLKRDVAIKVLPREFASDPSRLQRFASEAHAVAALNHPNILAIYDVGAEAGAPYIVTELIDGQSLRAAALSPRKALDCAVQIASGLAAAHEAGIVHRDLKPDNILLSRDGRIKILDFGLAKLNLPIAPGAATQTLAANTEPGTVMGTVGYMSPEQVRGHEADARSDIFSFGVVLHELLCGCPTFHGDTPVETMTAILKQDPPDLPDSVAPAVRQTVRHCLEKDPANRFQSSRDLAFALGAMAQSRSQSGPATTLPATSRWLRSTLTAVAALALVAATVAVYRLVFPTPPNANWLGVLLGGPETAFRPRPSPDGHLLAFFAVDQGYTQVAVMTPETGNWSFLTHSREHGNVTNVDWSPDGATLYYDRLSALPQGVYSVPVLGGDERLVIPQAFRPETLPDGTLLAVKLNANHQWQLFHFWPDTGRIQDYPIATVDIRESLETARAFPDGKHAVVDGAALGQEARGMQLLIVDLATGEARPLAPKLPRGTGAPAYGVTRDGKAVLVATEFGEFTRVLSVPVNGGPAETLFTTTHEVWGVDGAPDGSVYGCVTDLPAEVISRPTDRDQPQIWARFPEVSDPDALLALPDGRAVLTVLNSERARLMAVQPGKNPVPLVSTAEETSTPATLVGKREIAFLIGPAPHSTIAFADLETGRISRRLSPGKGQIVSLTAAPDGATLYFVNSGSIWSIPAAGGEPRKIRAGNRVVADPSGKSLLVSVFENTQAHLYRVPLDGSPESEIAGGDTHSPRYSDLWPGSLSPDGRLLVSLRDTWWETPAILDTHTGRLSPLPFDGPGSYFSMTWLPDGRMMAIRVGENSALWHFRRSRD